MLSRRIEAVLDCEYREEKNERALKTFVLALLNITMETMGPRSYLLYLRS